MKVRDGRGDNKTEEFIINQEMIKGWFKLNPNETAKQCSIFTGLSYKTVLNHIKKIKG